MSEQRQVQLVVGLGNPGPQYARNRHNVGFQVVERLAARAGGSFSKHPGRTLVARVAFCGAQVILAKPQTFMNLSGASVAALVHWYHLDPLKQLLVIYDDLDLPQGKVRMRTRGSAGGHKGLISIIEQLRTQDFARLRVGIGRPEYGEPHRYVLENFRDEEWDLMKAAQERTADAVECFLRSGIVAAMNQFNPLDGE
jgi:PTH1 family peptidyl-tRNA hydrolase